jgi:hypothetical protein
MKKPDENRIKQLLQEALPPFGPAAEPSRDLWPAVLRRLDQDSREPLRVTAGSVPHGAVPWPHAVPWFDWAILAGLVLFAISFPATIPVFLYYL